MTRNDIDDFLMWSSLIIYMAVWIGIPYSFLGGELWYVGVVWAGTYVSFHVVAIRTSGHCYLSADSAAFPAVLVVAVISTVSLHWFDVAPFQLHMMDYLKAFASSFILGHVLALAYSAVFHGILTACFGRE